MGKLFSVHERCKGLGDHLHLHPTGEGQIGHLSRKLALKGDVPEQTTHSGVAPNPRKKMSRSNVLRVGNG